jgi:hypothetical protein
MLLDATLELEVRGTYYRKVEAEEEKERSKGGDGCLYGGRRCAKHGAIWVHGNKVRQSL